MDDIIKLLDLEDENVYVSDVQVEFNTKYVTVESKLYDHICPKCGHKMYSRGIRTRIVKHPVLQDGYKMEIKLKSRRWRCCNDNCKHFSTDSFNFVSKNNGHQMQQI